MNLPTHEATAALAIGMSAGPVDAAQYIAEGGTREAIARCALPKPKPEDEAYFRKLGIIWKYGAPTSADKLLFEAVLPKGWRLVRCDHYLYSHLLDEKGRIRAEIMVHNIDRAAWISARCRFSADARTDNYVDAKDYFPAIVDAGKVVWRGAYIPETEAAKKEREDACTKELHAMSAKCKESGDWTDYHTAATNLQNVKYGSPMDRAQALATAKLNELLPGWQNRENYWDEEPTFPTSETEAPTGVEYTCQFSLHDLHDGRHVDSSYEPHRIVAKDDAEAIRRYTAWIATGFGKRYVVKATVKRGGASVHSFEIGTVRPPKYHMHDTMGFRKDPRYGGIYFGN